MKKIILWNILALPLLVFLTCSKAFNPLSDDVKASQAQAELEGIVKNSPYFDDSSQEDTSDTMKGPSTTNSGWFRIIDWQHATREIIFESLDLVNGTATIYVKKTFPGVIRIAKNWTQLLSGNYVQKSFTHYVERRAQFQRTDGIWRLTKITVALSKYVPFGVNPSLNITSVKVYRNTTELIINIPDTVTYFDRDTLPTLTSGDAITVHMDTANTISGTNYGYLHRQIYIRDQMHDSDGDGNYTNNYTVGIYKRVYYAWFDILDKATLDDKSNLTNYASVVWGLPYRIQ